MENEVKDVWKVHTGRYWQNSLKIGVSLVEINNSKLNRIYPQYHLRHRSLGSFVYSYEVGTLKKSNTWMEIPHILCLNYDLLCYIIR